MKRNKVLPPEMVERVKHNLRAMSIKEVAFTLKVSTSVVDKIRKGVYVPGVSATMKPICDAPFKVLNDSNKLIQ